jgi:hypothetical protein
MLVQQGGTFADTDAFESKARAVCGRARMAGRASKLHHGGIAITSFSMPLTIAGPRLPAFLRYSPFSPAYPLEGTEFELPRPFTNASLRTPDLARRSGSGMDAGGGTQRGLEATAQCKSFFEIHPIIRRRKCDPRAPCLNPCHQ